MTTLNDDEFGLEQPTRRAPRRNKTPRVVFLGGLHILLTRGLPDFVDEAGVLDTRKLARNIGVSYQALYKWFQRENVPPKRIGVLINLSKKQKTGKPDPTTKKAWSPLARDDFWEFLAR